MNFLSSAHKGRRFLEFRLNAEAEGHAIRGAGGVAVGRPVRDHNAESEGVAGIRRAKPPVRRGTVELFNAGVAGGEPGILGSLAVDRVQRTAENLLFCEEKQGIGVAADGAARITRRRFFSYFLDDAAKIGRELIPYIAAQRCAKSAASPASGVGIGAVHLVGGIEAVL